MAIVAGFDVHRAQITFDALDTETGEVRRGRIPADPESMRGWVGRFGGQRVDVAVEACTGWLFACEALREAGAIAHLAETAETRARRGSVLLPLVRLGGLCVEHQGTPFPCGTARVT